MGSANECCVACRKLYLAESRLDSRFVIEVCFEIFVDVFFLPKYRGSALLSEAKKKVDALQGKIREIEMQEKVLMQKIHQRKEHKKLSIF